MKFRNFKENEWKGLNIQMMMILDEARDIAKTPFCITSGLRTAEDNARVGGVSQSAHLRGLAVDLKCHEASKRYQIVNALLKVGFNRIGIYSDHIHVDMDASLPQNVMWSE